MTRTILVAVWCERCMTMIPPQSATRGPDGWLCRDHFTATREAQRRRRGRERAVGRDRPALAATESRSTVTR